jgi:hypothetical protein
MKKEKLLKSIPFICLALLLIARLLSNTWIKNNFLVIVTTLLIVSFASIILLKFPKELHKKFLLGISIIIAAIILFTQLFYI